jgi:transcriptional regulator with XRE-family HTH domain
MPAVEHEPDFDKESARLGEKVRHRAHKLDISQGELIAHTGLSRSYVQGLWNGRGSNKRKDGSFGPANPTMDVIRRISLVLEVDAGYLIEFETPLGAYEERPGYWLRTTGAARARKS